MMLQPVIVSAVVSAERNAVYTTVRLITMFGFMIPYALAMALFAASSVTPAIEDRDVSLAQRAQAVFRLSLVLSLGIYAGLFALAPLLLGVFGSGYATGGGGYLRIAGLACPLLVFKDQYIARCRARQDIGGLLPFALTMTIAEIAATLAGALAGDLRGALLGWIAALTLGAIWVSSIRSGARQAAPTPRRSADSAGQVAVPGTLQGADPLRATDGSIGESSVSVVVCTYDIGRFDQLIRCLGSIATQSVTPIEVVVVVDGSAEIAAALRRRVGPETVVVLERNLGMSAARNAGAARVRSTWVAFLDDDAVADPHWLDNLLECARRTGAAGVGGRSDPVFDPAEPRWLPPELLWTVGCSYRGMPTRSTVQRNTFGGCAVLRTDVFGLVGGYNVKLGRRGSGVQGGEEADLCLRIRAADPQAFFFYEPDAVIRHRVGASRLTRRYVLRRCLSDGRTKSTIARSSGRRALSTERTYLVRTALVGVLRAAATLRLQRAAVLVAGVGCAAAGYLIGRIGPAEPPAGLHSAKGLPVK
jgi:GT2 family glycosyltransferase